MTEPFKVALDRLCKEWEADAPEGETREEHGAALVLLFIQSELLRHGIDPSHQDAAEVTRSTLKKLRNPDVLGPAHSVAEAVFRRLPDNPKAAMAYLEQHVTEKRAAQSKRAKAPRSRRLDSITRLITDILADEPHLSAKEVERQLVGIEGIRIIDGEIVNGQDGTRVRASNLPSRVSDAKKRITSKQKFGRTSLAR